VAVLGLVGSVWERPRDRPRHQGPASRGRGKVDTLAGTPADNRNGGQRFRDVLRASIRAAFKEKPRRSGAQSAYDSDGAVHPADREMYNGINSGLTVPR
jgi:hypothetical protein